MKVRHPAATALFGLLTAFASATPLADPAVRELIALEGKWVAAENAKDADALRSILDENMMVISTNGVRTREEFIAGVMKGEPDPTQTQTLSDRHFLVDGDTGVSTEIDTVRGTRDGKPDEFSIRCTKTYVKRDGKWRAIAEVFSKTPDAK